MHSTSRTDSIPLACLFVAALVGLAETAVTDWSDFSTLVALSVGIGAASVGALMAAGASALGRAPRRWPVVWITTLWALQTTKAALFLRLKMGWVRAALGEYSGMYAMAMVLPALLTSVVLVSTAARAWKRRRRGPPSPATDTDTDWWGVLAVGVGALSALAEVSLTGEYLPYAGLGVCVALSSYCALGLAIAWALERATAQAACASLAVVAPLQLLFGVVHLGPREAIEGLVTGTPSRLYVLACFVVPTLVTASCLVLAARSWRRALRAPSATPATR